MYLLYNNSLDTRKNVSNEISDNNTVNRPINLNDLALETSANSHDFSTKLRGI